MGINFCIYTHYDVEAVNKKQYQVIKFSSFIFPSSLGILSGNF